MTLRCSHQVDHDASAGAPGFVVLALVRIDEEGRPSRVVEELESPVCSECGEKAEVASGGSP